MFCRGLQKVFVLLKNQTYPDLTSTAARPVQALENSHTISSVLYFGLMLLPLLARRSIRQRHTIMLLITVKSQLNSALRRGFGST
jgi:hypothetical protein